MTDIADPFPAAAPDVQHHEPSPNARVWYKHSQTGDRGYAVVREGRAAIRYDRPALDQVSFELDKWEKLVDDMPRFSAIQVAQVAFEADKKLCWAMGRHDLAKREWLDMTDKARAAWMGVGPPAAMEERVRLYQAIRAVFDPVDGAFGREMKKTIDAAWLEK